MQKIWIVFAAGLVLFLSTDVFAKPDRWINGKIVKDGLEVWAQVEKGNGKIWLRIVEKKAME